MAPRVNVCVAPKCLVRSQKAVTEKLGSSAKGTPATRARKTTLIQAAELHMGRQQYRTSSGRVWADDAPVSAARIQALWLCMTPLGRPVVPDVHRTADVSPYDTLHAANVAVDAARASKECTETCAGRAPVSEARSSPSKTR